MTSFLDGAIVMSFAAIGLFFWRFWNKSRDRFYIMFAVAFWILSANRLTNAMIPVINEGLPVYYLVRLLAFVVILIAIADKNYSR